MDFENTVAAATAISAANFATVCASIDFENTVAAATAISAANFDTDCANMHFKTPEPQPLVQTILILTALKWIWKHFSRSH